MVVLAVYSNEYRLPKPFKTMKTTHGENGSGQVGAPKRDFVGGFISQLFGVTMIGECLWHSASQLSPYTVTSVADLRMMLLIPYGLLILWLWYVDFKSVFTLTAL